MTQEMNAGSLPTEPVEQHGRRTSTRWMAGGAAVVLAGVAAFVAVETWGGDDKKGGVAGASSESDPNACDDLSFSNSAADGTRFESQAFLPKNEVSSASEATTYVNYLFGEDGPLGGNGDAASEAVVQAAVTEAAEDHAVFDPNRSISDAFDRKMGEYAGTNGLEVGKEDCKDSYNVLSQVYDWNAAWAHKGDKVVRLIAVRNEANDIIQLKAENMPNGALETMAGVELTLNGSTKAFDGFGDYLIGQDGVLYYKGVIKQDQQSKVHKEIHKGVKPTPSVSPSPENNNQQNNNQSNNNGGNKTTGDNGGGIQTGHQGCGDSGKADCGGGSGTHTGNKGPKGPGKGPHGGGGSPTPSPSHTPSNSPSPSNSPKPTPSPSHTPNSPSATPTPEKTGIPCDPDAGDDC